MVLSVPMSQELNKASSFTALGQPRYSQGIACPYYGVRADRLRTPMRKGWINEVRRYAGLRCH